MIGDLRPACFAPSRAYLQQSRSQTNEEDTLKWIRWECYKRYHGVYVEALGVYCGLSRRSAEVFDETTAPPAHCSFLILDRSRHYATGD
jgi:hypothetical protein